MHDFSRSNPQRRRTTNSQTPCDHGRINVPCAFFSFWIDIPILEKIMSASLTTKQVVVAKFLRHFFQGGIYVLNVIDSQSAGLSLVFVVIFEAVAVSWGYGRYLYSRCSRGVVYR